MSGLILGAGLRTSPNFSSVFLFKLKCYLFWQDVAILILALNYCPQLEDAGVKELLDILNALGGLDEDVEVDSLLDYLEKWRICLWDKAFIGQFSGSDIYGKGTWWKDFKGNDNIVKRLICRYFSWKILCSPHLFQTICFLSR